MQRVTPRQVRAARGLLGWKQEDLAAKSEISPSTIQRFEDGKGYSSKTYFQIVETLEDHGIEFIAADESRGPGVRLRRPDL